MEDYRLEDGPGEETAQSCSFLIKTAVSAPGGERN